ncbi:MAG: exodeoxyribonuclease III [Gammaproteobacteria bacterium]|nr:exodeoxyribonuclease III [Gammaproteobacteria bacterium]
MKVLTLNVCGIRASQKKGLFNWLKKIKPDLICLQEVRALEDQISSDDFKINGYNRYMSVAEKKGYSGVCIYTKETPKSINVSFGSKIFTKEGRFIELELKKINVISVYFPSGSSSEIRQDMKYQFMSKFESYLKKIQKKNKTILICGDWNIAHKEIDIKNWKANQKNSGFLPEERKWIDRIIKHYGCIDAFRNINKDPHNYTWWSNRGRAWDNNVGWRIDYQMLSSTKNIKVLAANIYKKERFSDHSPLIIDYDI